MPQGCLLTSVFAYRTKAEQVKPFGAFPPPYEGGGLQAARFMNPDEFRVAPPASSDAEDAHDAERRRALAAVRDLMNDLAASGLDLTYAINALATNLGALISQLPTSYRGPTMDRCGLVVAQVVAHQEKEGRAGGARMYEGDKPAN